LEAKYLTVSALTRYIKRKIDVDSHLRDVWLKGEISNFKHHSRGHMYLTVKDEQARVQAVMFAGNNRSLKFIPENGMKVFIRGNISVYEAYGQYQLYIEEMEPDGLGALYLAYEQLKEKLQKQGYFDSELSKESAFTLLPVNESFSTVLQSVAETTNAGKYEITNQRVVPDYLIKFSYSSPRVYEVAQKGKFGYKIYEQYIVGELIDKQGRIIYSSVGSNRIEDKDVGGIVFSKAARLEILLKNATVQLAEQFSKSIKFSSSTLPVTSTNGNIIEIQDVARQIRHNQNVLLYKNIGEINGVIGDVLVPVWEGMVVEKTDEQVRVELLAPVSEEFKTVSISKNDVVLLAALTAGNPPSDSTSMTYCTDIPSKLGAIGIDDFSVISRGFGYLLPYTLYDNDNIFTIKVQNAVRLGGFKVSSLELNKVDTKGRCLLPINKVTVENLNAGECNVTLAIGYRLYTDKEKKGAAAAQMNLVISDLQDGSLNSNIQCEITKNALGLLKDNIMKVQYK